MLIIIIGFVRYVRKVCEEILPAIPKQGQLSGGQKQSQSIDKQTTVNARLAGFDKSVEEAAIWAEPERCFVAKQKE